MGSASDAPLAAIERAMVRLRRSISRRELGRSLAAELGIDADGGAFWAVDAVDEIADEPASVATVGGVAERLGVDPSRASRLVASAVRAGYLSRVASQADGRQIVLALTDAGRDLVASLHAYRQAYFERIMRDWDPAERETFARLLNRFTATTSPPPGPGQDRA